LNIHIFASAVMYTLLLRLTNAVKQNNTVTVRTS